MANTASVAEKIPLEPVTSSNIAALGFDAEKNILAVQFKSGDIYHHAPVSAIRAAELYMAGSRGKYYNENIKGKVPGAKMTGACPKCGAKHGWIGETCTDCGCAVYEDERAGR